MAGSLHRIRSFASSPIAHAASLVPTEVPKVIASVFSSPNPDELRAQELDVDVIPPEDVRIELTDRAAEVCPLFFVDQSSSYKYIEAIEIYSYAGAPP